MIPGNRAGYKKEYIMNQIIAHRGASAYAPENTMASFNKALSLGSRFIEFDVMLSAAVERVAGPLTVKPPKPLQLKPSN